MGEVDCRTNALPLDVGHHGLLTYLTCDVIDDDVTMERNWPPVLRRRVYASTMVPTIKPSHSLQKES